MKTWNIGNTTVRNPYRLREALQLFRTKMGGRPFRREEQQEFLNELVKAELVASDRAVEGDDGGRKFASAFKQLGFVTDWERGKSWDMTPVGTMLIEHPELEELIFLRQLMKYQIPSPLESGKRVEGFHVRPLRLLLRFLKRAREENLIGLTKFEIALNVINVLDENDNTAFEEAMSNIKKFRADYNAITGKVNKNRFTNQKLVEAAAEVDLVPGSLLDYADSNGRYALITGLLTTHGNKLTLSDARLPVVEAILTDGTSPIPERDYLELFYNPNIPLLPTDDLLFLKDEIVNLEKRFVELATLLGESAALPAEPTEMTISELQAYEIRLRDKLRDVREIQFYRNQCSATSLDEIKDLLEDINTGAKAFFGGSDYAPAFLEWAIWRLFLAIDEIVGPISRTRGFRIDEDINPVHHAKGGEADLTFTYDNFKLVCEMTLTSGSRQFVAEGEPVTRHIFKAIETSDGKPVYGLFITKKLDPNTIDAFHKARYWKNYTSFVSTPVVALEIEQVLKLIERIKMQGVDATNFRELLDHILQLQDIHPYGPAWYKGYSKLYEQWVNTEH
jgi:AlwI restriction endonuclease